MGLAQSAVPLPMTAMNAARHRVGARDRPREQLKRGSDTEKQVYARVYASAGAEWGVDDGPAEQEQGCGMAACGAGIGRNGNRGAATRRTRPWRAIMLRKNPVAGKHQRIRQHSATTKIGEQRIGLTVTAGTSKPFPLTYRVRRVIGRIYLRVVVPAACGSR